MALNKGSQPAMHLQQTTIDRFEWKFNFFLPIMLTKCISFVGKSFTLLKPIIVISAIHTQMCANRKKLFTRHWFSVYILLLNSISTWIFSEIREFVDLMCWFVKIHTILMIFEWWINFNNFHMQAKVLILCAQCSLFVENVLGYSIRNQRDETGIVVSVGSMF